MSERVHINRLPTGVEGLDEVLGGGLPELSFNLIAGPPGSGKTTTFPLGALGVYAFNIDDRCAQLVGSYLAIPRHVRAAAPVRVSSSSPSTFAIGKASPWKRRCARSLPCAKPRWP